VPRLQVEALAVPVLRGTAPNPAGSAQHLRDAAMAITAVLDGERDDLGGHRGPGRAYGASATLTESGWMLARAMVVVTIISYVMWRFIEVPFENT
jgi:hypothetical protein